MRAVETYKELPSVSRCLKKSFPSIEEAERRMLKINSDLKYQNRKAAKLWRTYGGDKPKKIKSKLIKRWYWCGECKAYHLTSKSIK